VQQSRAVTRSPLVAATLRDARGRLGALAALTLLAVIGTACSAIGYRAPSADGTGGSPTVAASGNGGAGGEASAPGSGGGIVFDSGIGDVLGVGVAAGCSSDLHAVVDAVGNVVQQCSGTDGCIRSTLTCGNACQATVDAKLAVGCEYYATDMDQYSVGLCFAAFVANTWDTPVHIAADLAGTQLEVAEFGRIPDGVGPALTYAPYDPVAGLPPGQVAILFLAGDPSSDAPCPEPTADPLGGQIFNASGVGSSFHITTDVPVVAYEINPYGGGSAAVTGASLLLPTSVWDTNYLAVTAAPYDPVINGPGGNLAPSMNIIAAEDGTVVTMLPSVAVTGGGALPAGLANVPYRFMLDKGQQAQFTQPLDLTGTIIQSTKPVGFMAGHPCMRAPLGVAYCDHGEQMIPPVRALGHEYAGVMFRARVLGDAAIWRVVGVVDGTTLTYSDEVGGPISLKMGQTVDFVSEAPFVVTSQDSEHPFMLFTHMSGSQWGPPKVAGGPLFDTGGYGDADFVLGVPPQQYNNDYVFFADPTYPETNLVVIRTVDQNEQFDDVTLDCAGTLGDWHKLGKYEWTRVDLITGDFWGVGNCSTGRHEIKSAGPFGLWVWGWGTPETTSFTANVSYGYPGGMSVTPINTVVVTPLPT
jgi:IgGFc binding protein